MTYFIMDVDAPELINHFPDYRGEVWFNTEDVNCRVTIRETVLKNGGSQADLTTLYYQVSNDPKRKTDTGWKPASYKVVSSVLLVDKLEYTVTQTTITAPIPVTESTSNYVFWRLQDQAGNVMETTYIAKGAPGDDEYELERLSKNPSNVWVDTTPVTFSDYTPGPEPQESRTISPTVVITDLGSTVDSSTIQYSISRNGLGNYGGWISAGLIVDASTVVAETVSEILFQPGTSNYGRWRAKDLANNGYTYSPDYLIEITPDRVNNPPVIGEDGISSPENEEVFTTRDIIKFDCTRVFDPDGDPLDYEWRLANHSVLSRESSFEILASQLGVGTHVISLYVTDMRSTETRATEYGYTTTSSFAIYVNLHPDEADTDGDGIVDGEDDDDDGDGVLDTDELRMGTNPKLKDTDGDGVNDQLDPEPLNPLVISEDKHEDEYSYWEVMYAIIVLAIVVILIASMLVLRRRSVLEKRRIERAVAREARMVQRYETLTGVESPLLPSVKDMGLSLPPIAAQQVASMGGGVRIGKREEPKEKEPEAAPAPVEAPAPAPAPEPESKPEAPPKVGTPVSKRRSRKPGSAPGAVPTPEELMQTAALPGTADTSAPRTATCDLCGSTIEVPEGATTVECPLCGEKKGL